MSSVVINIVQLEGLVIIAGIFLLAGAVKGVVGLGLPTVSLVLLTLVFDLKSAMAMIIIPSLITNIWQGLAGGALLILIQRFWLMFVLTFISIGFAVKLLHVINIDVLSTFLGLVILIYALYGLTVPKIPDLRPKERWISPIAGVVNGIIVGMTGSAVMPGVPYFQSLHLTRDQMIQAMGMLFSISALGLGAAMANEDLLTMNLTTASLAGLVPAFIGMWGGLLLRRRVSQITFRRILFYSLFIIGAFISVRAFL